MDNGIKEAVFYVGFRYGFGTKIRYENANRRLVDLVNNFFDGEEVIDKVDKKVFKRDTNDQLYEVGLKRFVKYSKVE